MTTTLPIALADLRSPVVDAALRAAAVAVGTEAVLIGVFGEGDLRVLRLVGAVPGVAEGMQLPRHVTMCDAMVAGAPRVTADAALLPAYADLPAVTELGITTYVAAPIEVGGRAVGVLCGIDRSPKAVDDKDTQALAGLASVLAASVRDAGREDVVVRRSESGWRVGAEDGLDLTSAMSLADLLLEAEPPAERPPRPADEELSEVQRLQLSVRQLEHALAARVLVEQAIGVLSERQHLSPRVAFERLRKAARARGRKVVDLAREVVSSTVDPTVPLPPELAGRR